MIGARARAFALVAIAALVVAALALEAVRWQPQQRPALLLLTSLPLLFNEDFSLEGGGSPALNALRARFRVEPISVTDKRSLAKGGLLLMAHPPAQTAENLVELDDWVRRGGRVLLLADPLLEWPSKRPLGDPLRPAPMFSDTGLLGHWGLRLDAPEQRGSVGRELGGYDVMTISPGRLSGDCRITADRLIADCRIGKGRAIVVADADFLNTKALGSAAQHNLDGLTEELARLARK
jgi:hypothetical protein